MQNESAVSLSVIPALGWNPGNIDVERHSRLDSSLALERRTFCIKLLIPANAKRLEELSGSFHLGFHRGSEPEMMAFRFFNARSTVTPVQERSVVHASTGMS
jgi:hypothetical protein